MGNFMEYELHVNKSSYSQCTSGRSLKVGGGAGTSWGWKFTERACTFSIPHSTVSPSAQDSDLLVPGSTGKATLCTTGVQLDQQSRLIKAHSVITSHGGSVWGCRGVL